jgi:DNA-binding NarL/FixJ family response regulator
VTPRTIAIADIHPVVRAGIRSYCAQSGWAVIAECQNHTDVLDAINTHRPEFAIIDPSLPGGDFGDLAARIAEMSPGTRIIAHSASRDVARIRALLAAGASGYVLKDGPASQLIEAAEHIDAGLVYVSSDIEFGVPEQPKLPDPASVLTEREYQIFLQFGSGARPRDIAASLGLSAKTVDTYRSKIIKKLNLDGMAALVRRAASISRD